MLVMPFMANAMKKDKIIGGLGLAAVVVFVVATVVAIFTYGSFTSGSAISNLFEELAFMAGCVIAGIIGAAIGLLMMLDKDDSKVFIGKIRGILIMLTGVVLAVLGATQGEQWAVYAFIVLIIFAAAADMFYDWVTDQKIIMVIALFFTLIIALMGMLSQIGGNELHGIVFVIFAVSWAIIISGLRFAPVAEAEPESKKSKKAKAKEQKKNAPAPKPYPAKKEEPPAQKKPATEKPVYQEKPKETAKKEEPIKVMSSKDAAAEAKKDEPKLKVMSSKEAAAAREARKKEEPVPEPIPEPIPEPVPEPEPIPEPEPEPPEEEEYGELEFEEDTPDALLRRATWNKGLRCRRNYGEYQIPIAYVKAKVAVYVQEGPVDPATEEKLRAGGWTVLCYKEKDISDGKEQAEEIGKAVKENIRAERAAKKKKKK